MFFYELFDTGINVNYKYLISWVLKNSHKYFDKFINYVIESNTKITNKKLVKHLATKPDLIISLVVNGYLDIDYQSGYLYVLAAKNNNRKLFDLLIENHVKILDVGDCMGYVSQHKWYDVIDYVLKNSTLDDATAFRRSLEAALRT